MGLQGASLRVFFTEAVQERKETLINSVLPNAAVDM